MLLNNTTVNYYSHPSSIAKLIIKQVDESEMVEVFFPFTRLYLPIHGTSVRTKRLSKQGFFVPAEMIICEETPFIFNSEGSYFFVFRISCFFYYSFSLDHLVCLH